MIQPDMKRIPARMKIRIEGRPNILVICSAPTRPTTPADIPTPNKINPGTTGSVSSTTLWTMLLIAEAMAEVVADDTWGIMPMVSMNGPNNSPPPMPNNEQTMPATSTKTQMCNSCKNQPRHNAATPDTHQCKTTSEDAAPGSQ